MISPGGPIPTTSSVDRAHLFRGDLSWKTIWAVAILLALYAVGSILASRNKAQAFDEGEHIAIGYDMWMRRDFRMETANGDFVKRWATIPLLVVRPQLPATENPAWRNCQPYRFAFDFMFGEGNDPRRILLYCRSMVALIGIALGLLIFFLSSELFGSVGGLISLALYVTSPSMLAFGGIVSTELTTCISLVGAVWSSWHLLHEVTWRRLAFCLGFCALFVLSKPTAIIMFPLSGLAVAIRLYVGRPLTWGLFTHRVITSRVMQLGAIGGLAVLHIVFAWAALWTAYDFRYTASPYPSDPGVRVVTPTTDPIDPTIASFLNWSQRHHVLPEGFLRGIELLLGQKESQLAFMNGRWYYGGSPFFFPYTIWAKSNPAHLLAFTAAAVTLLFLAFRSASRRRVTTAAGAIATDDLLYRVTPYLLMILVYFSIAETWDMNIGFRHIVPIYTAAFVLSGALGAVWTAGGVARRAALIALLAASAWTPLSVYPHFLASFSPLIGGSGRGYQHLVDSSLDWGMDLPGLKAWLDRHNRENQLPVFFAYFGVSNPDFYHIKCFHLPSRPDWRNEKSFPLGPGIYVISATLFQGIGTPAPGPWNQLYERAWWRSLAAINRYDETLNDPAAHAALLARTPQRIWDAEYTRFEQLRFARLCAWLRHHRPPDDNVGFSILIWRLSKNEVFDAGLGPPSELEAAPIQHQTSE